MKKPDIFDVDTLSDGYIHFKHGIPMDEVNSFRVGARYANHANGNLFYWYEKRISELEAQVASACTRLGTKTVYSDD